MDLSLNGVTSNRETSEYAPPNNSIRTAAVAEGALVKARELKSVGNHGQALAYYLMAIQANGLIKV